ncbi:MAG: hypothetical protein ACLR70_04565 [Streptococcus thermophilus]
MTPHDIRACRNFMTNTKTRSFEILDFPCNQFMGQAPGSAEEIQ